MSSRRSSIAFAVLIASGMMATAQADILLIDRVHQEQRLSLPTRGLSMAQVEQRYGTPSSKLAPAGGDSRVHPTINRWVYTDYTVYFERDRVIDSVANRASPNEIGPKSAAPHR
ncbi:MAG: hypothetical protein JSR65_04455 [Proteobacteria bacterium]|nr:hypothetical protein [Pseudomonadota bacterium]